MVTEINAMLDCQPEAVDGRLDPGLSPQNQKFPMFYSPSKSHSPLPPILPLESKIICGINSNCTMLQ